MADETKPLAGENQTDPLTGGAETQAVASDAQAVSETISSETISLEEARKLRSEAANLRKRLKELEGKVRAEEEAKMTEQEKLQKRLAELERQSTEYQQTMQARTLEYEVKLHAARLGVVDPEAAYRLLDIREMEFGEDGKPANIEKALRALIAAKPYLAGGGGQVSPTNPAQGKIGGQQVFTRSQLRDPNFFAANREAIMQAMRDGRIQED